MADGDTSGFSLEMSLKDFELSLIDTWHSDYPFFRVELPDGHDMLINARHITCVATEIA